MKIQKLERVRGKDEFAITVQIKANEVKYLQQKAYKNGVSVQKLLRGWLTASLQDLVIFVKENHDSKN